VSARLHGQVIERDDLAVVVSGRAPRQIQLDRFEDVAPSECRAGRTPAQQDLVDVVVEDEAESLEVVPAERQADVFRERVADRVRMAGAFAFDDLDRFETMKLRVGGANEQVQDVLSCSF
jgi:hypothetical protein